MLNILFYVAKQMILIKYNNYKFSIYYNSISTIILSISIPLCIFVSMFFLKQVDLISKGLTLKQYSSILEDLAFKKSINKNCSDKRISNKTTFKKRLLYIKKFLYKKRKESLYANI